MLQYKYTKEQSYQKISNFFDKEIAHLKTPILNNRPNCVTVGPYRAITNGKIYEVWKSRQKLCDFSQRSWGVGYALCMYQHQHKQARKLQEADDQYTRMLQKKDSYKHHLRIAQKRDDVSKQDIFWSRLSRIEYEIFKIESTTNKLLKSIRVG
jgi:hypothetical protein